MRVITTKTVNEFDRVDQTLLLIGNETAMNRSTVTATYVQTDPAWAIRDKGKMKTVTFQKK